MRTFCLLLFLACSGFSQEKKHTVYFETDLSIVSYVEKNRLLSFITTLSEQTISSVEVYGFCDDLGGDNYNMVLSQYRAEEIKKILLLNDISEERITNVNGKGELLLRLVKAGSAERLRALNRKVELVVSTVEPLEEVKESVVAKGKSLVIENLLFLTGYSYLTPSSKKSLDVAFQKVKNIPFSFIIQGHVCCTTGKKDAIDRATKKRNLSLVRAKLVYDYFVKKGVDPKRMSYEGMGHRFPLGGRPEKDRRVEILIGSSF